MRNLVCWCLVVAITLVHKTSAQGSTTWNCDTMRPNLSVLRNKEPSSPDTSPFRLSVKSTDSATESTMVQVQAGQSVTVGLSVRPPGEITGFILQARQVGSTEPQGTWSVPPTNDLVQVTKCGEKEKDTVVNKVLLAVKVHEMTWTAPMSVPEGYEVQLVGAAIDGSAGITGEYWNLHGNAVVKIQVTTAVVVPEEPNPGTNPGNGENQEDENNQDPQVDPQITPLDVADEHDLLLETRMEQDYLQQKQADIAMENLQSETDNTMEEDKKRHEEEYKWEMEDYEKRMYEEEVRRQARIDAELRDKEEWEAQQYELERQREEEEKRRREHRREMLGDTLQEVDVNEIGNGEKKTSAGYRQTSTYVFYTCFVIIIAALL